MPYEVQIGDKKVTGKEMGFEPLAEQWNKYQLEDGTIIKARLNVLKIIRVVDEKGDPVFSEQNNEPVYAINHRIDVVVSNLE